MVTLCLSNICYKRGTSVPCVSTAHEIIISKYLKHPGCMKCYDAFHDNDTVYLVLEYAEGGDLLRFLPVYWCGVGGPLLAGLSRHGHSNGPCLLAPWFLLRRNQANSMMQARGGRRARVLYADPPPPSPPPPLKLAPKCRTIGTKGAESKFFLMRQRVENGVFTLCVYTQYTRNFQEKSIMGKNGYFFSPPKISIPPLSRVPLRWLLP